VEVLGGWGALFVIALFVPLLIRIVVILGIRGLDDLERAAAPLTIGVVAYVFEKRNARTVGRKSSKTFVAS
jgi:hypothetical protein